jgi:hypothetical protein
VYAVSASTYVPPFRTISYTCQEFAPAWQLAKMAGIIAVLRGITKFVHYLCGGWVPTVVLNIIALVIFVHQAVLWLGFAWGSAMYWLFTEYGDPEESPFCWLSTNSPLERFFLHHGLLYLRIVRAPPLEVTQTFGAWYAALWMLFMVIVMFVRRVQLIAAAASVRLPNCSEDMVQIARSAGVDEALLSHLVLNVSFKGRTVAQIEELKRRAMSWVALNRKNWSERDKLHQIQRALACALSYSEADSATARLLGSDDVFAGMSTANALSRGNLPGGRKLLSQ